MHKKFLILFATILLLTSAALAAEGEGVRVGIIDSGISTAAVDAGRIAEGRNYIRPQDDTGDRLGHGTAVAAVIVGSRAAGLAGVCETAALVPLVYCSRDERGQLVQGGSDLVAEAIYDAVDTYRCRIVNISSGSKTGSDALRDACAYAESRGVLIVASAGNSGLTDPDTVYYPGGYDGVLSVGACDETGAIADFSQKKDTIDVLARGTGLYLASADGARVRGEGTSFAAALVSGMAARIWTAQPELTAAQVRARLLALARDVDGWAVLELDAVLATAPDGFADVRSTDYFYDAVRWARDAGVTGGTSQTSFSPNAPCTRGQIVTFLYRAAGSPQTDGAQTFCDVAPGAYYDAAANWASVNGIAGGTGGGKFSPDAPCTRAQALALLYRAAGSPDAAADGGFADVPSGSYYEAAASWALQTGISSGTGAGRFSPDSVCTRGQIVTLLYNFYAQAA